MGTVAVACRLQSAASVVGAHGLSCSAACGIFPDQGLNPCPLHWQVEFFFNYFILFYFIFGCVGSSLLYVGFSLVVARGGYSSLWCTGFSLWWLFLLGAWALGMGASVVVAHGLSSCGSWALECRLSSCGSCALECRLSSCGTRALLLCGMWDLPGSGLKPVSPALAGGFLTPVPPRKP